MERLIRDTRKDANYWQTQLEQDLKRIEKARINSITSTDDIRKKYRSASRAIRLSFTRTIALYSAGQPIEKITNLAKSTLVKDYPKYLKTFPHNQYGPSRPSTDKMARYLSLLVLSCPTQDEAKAFVEAYDHWDYSDDVNKPERDYLWEAMIAYLGCGNGRKPANTLFWPEAYEPLWRAADLETDSFARIGYMKRFLDGWYDEMASELAANTDLLSPETTFGAYVGYWCLEAAAVAVMMDIDDTSFRDHEHYPKDLVDWARYKKANG